jgi:hypothetical protein
VEEGGTAVEEGGDVIDGCFRSRPSRTRKAEFREIRVKMEYSARICTDYSPLFHSKYLLFIRSKFRAESVRNLHIPCGSARNPWGSVKTSETGSRLRCVIVPPETRLLFVK